MNKQNGILVISLDFELFWGIRGRLSFDEYKANILGVRSVIPRLLELFKKYEIHSTWAIVGLLFFRTRNELTNGLPECKPYYDKDEFSPYQHINKIGNNEQDDPYHYAYSLIKMIASTSFQEIGTHTFSHYYCLEKGQTPEMFRSDLEAAIKVAIKNNINIKSLVFPKNQFNKEYLQICRESGIKCFRGNEQYWVYSPKKREKESILLRGIRLLDSYVNISGHNTYDKNDIKKSVPYNIAASRFLRPCYKKYSIFEPLKLKRILSDITYAAKNNQVYHLWWHPHNFGTDTNENFLFLEKIFKHFILLKKNYGMRSMNMGNISDGLEEGL